MPNTTSNTATNFGEIQENIITQILTNPIILFNIEYIQDTASGIDESYINPVPINFIWYIHDYDPITQ